jgi:hypothetical protein
MFLLVVNLINNNHKLTYIVIAIITLLVGGYIFLFFSLGTYVSYELDYQINTMIKNHDIKEMKRVSDNKKIYSFLLHLNKKDTCKNTSDFQGGDKNVSYYGTEIKGKAIGVDMKKDKNIHFMPVSIWRVNKLYFTEK